MRVASHCDRTVAVVILDSPSIDTPPLTAQVRQRLLASVSEYDADPQVRAVVLQCDGWCDARDWDIPADLDQSPSLADVVAAIEGAAKPWVAALRGAVLGAPLELAMGCHGRVAHVDTRLGLPEVTLGLLPCAGGTVRLPRLVPPLVALGMVATGRAIGARAAQQAGLVDLLCEDGPVAAACGFAEKIGAPQPTIRRRPSPRGEGFEQAAQAYLAQANGQVSAITAVEAVRQALGPAEAALAAERSARQSLLAGPEATALRYIHGAERRASAAVRRRAASSRLASVGVVGDAPYAVQLSVACLLSGLEVRWLPQDSRAAGQARRRVEQVLAEAVSAGLLDAEAHHRALSAFALVDGLAALNTVDLILEFGGEDGAARHAALSVLSPDLERDAALVAVTRQLDLEALTEGLVNCERVIGLRPIASPTGRDVFEIAVPQGAREDLVDRVAALTHCLGATAILADGTAGGVGHRVMQAGLQEAEYLLEEGASPSRVDAAMRAQFYVEGPFQWRERVGCGERSDGPQIAAQQGISLPEALRKSDRLAEIMGTGWRDDWTVGLGQGATVTQLIEVAGSGYSAPPRQFTDQALVVRIEAAMAAEGRALQREGVVARASDIDVVMVWGFGVPRRRGGPMFAGGMS